MNVFISSLIRGLETVRDAVASGVSTLGHRAVRAEDFGASPDSPQAACLAGDEWTDVKAACLEVFSGRCEHPWPPGVRIYESWVAGYRALAENSASAQSTFTTRLLRSPASSSELTARSSGALASRIQGCRTTLNTELLVQGSAPPAGFEPATHGLGISLDVLRLAHLAQRGCSGRCSRAGSCVRHTRFRCRDGQLDGQ